MYSSVDLKAHFPKLEEEIQQFWKQQDIFQKSLEKNKKKHPFVFYDGPPFATGLPHFGHFVPGTVKDIIPRYKTMKGYFVKRNFGWDCHGLPVEYEVEKELGISGKYEIERYGIDEFNEKCKVIVTRYTSQWREIIERLGRWVDFENDYKTMDLNYMESIWWVFAQLWKKKYVYQGHYILPYSPALATPLSNFEVNLGGYQQVNDPSVTIRFALQGRQKTYFLAWTTTPWTLPSNMGLGVHSDIIYVEILDKSTDDTYILAEARLLHYYKDDSEYTIKKRHSGKDLVGIQYSPIFSYFSYLADQGGFVVHSADFVSVENGTGIVHMAGGFGEDDYNIVCKKAQLPLICPIDDECRFTDEVPDYKGLFVKDADKQIISYLKDHNMLVKRENYLHSYPFCYRTKKPLIYRAVRSWFVSVNKLKEIMIACNDTIQWHPQHLKKGRFGIWLEGARDWAISRNRFWGNPIPVWMNENGTHIEVIDSISALEKKSGQHITDLHKHFIDKITWNAPDGSEMRRVPEVLDCWFESGAMPYAQNHYPFENKESFERTFPADFISEGLDQTRGWFYTLMVLAAGLFEKPAFKNVIVNGLVLAEDGKKMSKSEKNFTDPIKVINNFGSDALRLFLMSSSVLKAEDLRYSDESVREEMKNFILPLWSAYSFFVTYANIDGIEISTDTKHSDTEAYLNPLDEWIESERNALIEKVESSFEQYDIPVVLQKLYGFLDLLNNWYIRRSRRRFWKSANDTDKIQGYETLYSVLLTFIKLSAPVIPFITETIYQNLKTNAMPESIHLCDFPTSNKKRNERLEYTMRVVRKAIALGRGIRSLYNIKNRQPLSMVYLFTKEDKERQALNEMEDIIKEELNVKEVVFRQNEEDMVQYKAKANYKVLGKILGKHMKKAADVISKLSVEHIRAILDGKDIALDVEGKEIIFNEGNIIIERKEKDALKVLNEGSLTAALDSQLTQELIQEGIVRDIVRLIQNIRKQNNFSVTDRIKVVFISLPEEVKQAITAFKEYLKNEVLATDIIYASHEQEISTVPLQTIHVLEYSIQVIIEVK